MVLRLELAPGAIVREDLHGYPHGVEVDAVEGAGDVSIQLLGPVEVSIGGRRVDGVSTKSRAVIAVLASRPGTVVSVDFLIDAVWGERAPASVRSSLQVHVAKLRKLLARYGAHDLIEFRRPGYLLSLEPAAVDASRWSALLGAARRAMAEGDLRAAASTARCALELWTGDALGGLGDDGTAPLVRAQLQAERVAAAELAFTAELGLGQHGRITAEIDEWAAKEPYREALWGLLATALYRSGRQSEALTRIATLRRTLRADLGLEVSPPIAALELAILEHDPALASSDGGRLDRLDRVSRTNVPMSLTEMVTPLKPLEAMAQGRMFVASDVGGHRELVRHGQTGFLFKAGDPAALVTALDDLLAQRDGWQRIREQIQSTNTADKAKRS